MLVSRTRVCLVVALLLVGACSRGPTQEPTARAPLFDNLGGYHHAITTASPEAQRYFDQGLTLSYAFNHAEAADVKTRLDAAWRGADTPVAAGRPLSGP